MPPLAASSATFLCAKDQIAGGSCMRNIWVTNLLEFHTGHI